MNRGARHELAERTFAARHVRPPDRWVRASTTSPFDLVVLRPQGNRLKTTFVEIKTARGRFASDLSVAEAEFARFAEFYGSPYVVARYRVVGPAVTGERIYRPFALEGTNHRELEFLVEASGHGQPLTSVEGSK
jgi:hypothetical protein